jgi:hypothetical protein
MSIARQAVVTAATGSHAERLERTFASFRLNSFLELHALIIGDRLPQNRVEGVTYHLVAPDPVYQGEMRELYYRRLILIDQLGFDYVLLVDNSDVLCLREIPELPVLLRGAAIGACVEHNGSQFIQGQGYTSAYLNAGVTFWNVQASRRIRAEIVERGLARFRSIDDQLTLNEVVHTRYYDDLVILPCQYNYRPCLAPMRIRGWPTVSHLDGVRIYHNKHCIEAAKRLVPVAPLAVLPELKPDRGPLSPLHKFLRRVQHRLFYRHHV